MSPTSNPPVHGVSADTNQAATATDLDAQAVAKLRELDPDGRLGVVQRVMKAYEASLERAIGQLQGLHQAAADPAAAKQLNMLAHTLKSSSASVGALQLSSACNACEKRLQLQPGLDLKPEIEQLLTPAEAALRAVRDMLAR